MAKSNILFIINPISGGKDKLKIPALIDANLDRSKFNPNYSVTEYVGHAAEIAEEAANKNFDIIVAVGGDGTINEIGSKVILQNKVLGIIPFGSGNGLARFLKIPMSPVKAIKVINELNIKQIDTATFNDKVYFNMAGMGFDAHISSIFAGHKTRGLSGYVKLGLQEMLSYKPATYTITVDGKVFTRTAFVVSIANSSQYGNNAHISPLASVSDGLLDVCVVRNFPLYKLPLLAYHMMTANTHRTDMVEIIQGKQIHISRPKEDAIHIDGEPFFMGKDIDISVKPLSLNIIVPAGI
ncbi:diacylglycerol/lipid kinase family protein [Pedobacter nutrimenti]|uniref:YegS/Rv2252/BmrU family lipid kinase n=1 Tax=Pedobacter nutrimenti TaxID=1241337 RepID=A0A318UND1_9SPHI|nr:YegS/Rv2252/BmrU family lipid kinase [Pedobacter nutrimenti]PYF75575.1 YegS/Rv2252/BmrU family lipid kinase [Pedobacter nutrimenti]